MEVESKEKSNCFSYFFLAVATLLLPPLLLKFILEKKYRGTISERLAFGPWRPEKLADTLKTASPKIWIHAASVGEVGGISPLLSKFEELGYSQGLLLTTTSRTGQQKAKEDKRVAAARLLPLDHPWVLARALDSFTPDLCLIAETELWPNFLFSLRRRSIPTVLLNARISDYSFPNYLRFRPLIAPALRTFSLILAQTATDGERFLKLGASEEQLVVVGSTKYDQARVKKTAEELAEYAQAMGVDPARPCFVAGSVREVEDEIVLESYLSAKKVCPNLQLIIAPRHPERFSDVAALLARKGVSFNRRSAPENNPSFDILLLDTLGELNQAYSLASFSFVGGTLVDIGGHNPLEAASSASPVLMGPHSSNVKDAVLALKRAGGMFEVQNSEELAREIISLVDDDLRRQRAGLAAEQVARSNLGATERVLKLVLPFLSVLLCFCG
jgi:3-deoxy-D-manno-octulosonic-acid transferase